MDCRLHNGKQDGQGNWSSEVVSFPDFVDLVELYPFSSSVGGGVCPPHCVHRHGGGLPAGLGPRGRPPPGPQARTPFIGLLDVDMLVSRTLYRDLRSPNSSLRMIAPPTPGLADAAVAGTRVYRCMQPPKLMPQFPKHRGTNQRHKHSRVRAPPLAGGKMCVVSKKAIPSTHGMAVWVGWGQGSPWRAGFSFPYYGLPPKDRLWE